MAMTFDATLKDLGRESPRGFLAAFDRPPKLPVTLLNVDLSTVTRKRYCWRGCASVETWRSRSFEEFA